MSENRSKKHRKYDASNDFFARASRVIPLASQTFSKSALQFVKGNAPLFLDRAKGCHVWDIDGNEYLDFMMGLLPVVLGHGDADVNAAITEQLDRGVSFSLATKLETQLAETLINLIPSAEMVRYGKNGSDATSAAIRLARAHTGRSRVACCGYHGWHDWYIGTTTRNLGVPAAVQDLTSVFAFNQAASLEKLLAGDPTGFAAVIIEPIEFETPENDFLPRIREITNKYGVILIFDEIITGFRLHIGGAQTYFNVIPDLSCFGKSIANGMPLSAIVGRRTIMKNMEEIFFSGTFGGEALSLAAALATIEKLKNTNAISHMHAFGKLWKENLQKQIDSYHLNTFFEINGEDWWPRIRAKKSEQLSAELITSLLRQELAEQGILQASSCNISLAHTENSVIDKTFHRWDKAFSITSKNLQSVEPKSKLRGDLIRPVFQIRK